MDESNKKVNAVVGIDVSDRSSEAVILDSLTGSLSERLRFRNSLKEIREVFSNRPRLRIALEVGTHSPWMSRVLESLGHEVIVANARRVQLIGKSTRKSDSADAMTLARLARLDAELLAPIRHRSAAGQSELIAVRSRRALVRTRTLLVNHLRGASKSCGMRLPKCTTGSFARKVTLPTELESMRPVLETIGEINKRIVAYDVEIESLADRHPETAALRQVSGVGALTSLVYVLTLEDPSRFAKSRDVGAYLGLAPALRESGDRSPQLHISKEGDPYLRSLLVQAAHYILGPFGPDCDLRRHGLELAQRGGKAAKKRAAVAVARKLAVLLHRLWITQKPYEALRQAEHSAA